MDRENCILLNLRFTRKGDGSIFLVASIVELRFQMSRICLCKRYSGKKSCRVTVTWISLLPWGAPADSRPPHRGHHKSLWLWEGILSMCRAGQSQDMKPSSSPQAKKEDGTVLAHLWGAHFSAVFHSLPESPCVTEPPVTHTGDSLINTIFIGVLPVAVSLLCFCTVLPGIIFCSKAPVRNPHLRVGAWGRCKLKTVLQNREELEKCLWPVGVALKVMLH